MTHSEPSSWIKRWTHLLPPKATVLDVACGRGRHMQWFAERGHPVLGLDRNPDVLQSARAFGEALTCDLETAPWPLGSREFGAVIVTNYLWRPLFDDLIKALAPGGLLLYETFADGQQTVGKPSNPDFLLQSGELLRACAGLQVVGYEHGCLESPLRFVQRIVAVRTCNDRSGLVRCALSAPQCPSLVQPDLQ